MLLLTHLINKAYKSEGFVSALIFGNKGIGKTSYALHVAKEVYGDWECVLDYLFFNPKHMIELFKSALRKGERIPLVIADDAGLWLSKTTWWDKHKTEFCEFFDIIRTVCSCVIFTTPSDNLIKKISKEIDLRIKINYLDPKAMQILSKKGINVSDKLRIAKIYSFSLSPLFQPIVKVRGYDIFPAHYPDNIKIRYDEIRREAVMDKLIKVEEALTEGSRKNLDRKILELLDKGYSKTKIAQILGISRTTVYNRLKKSDQN